MLRHHCCGHKTKYSEVRNASMQDLCTALTQPHSQSTSKASLADIMPLFTWMLQLEVHSQPSHFSYWKDCVKGFTLKQSTGDFVIIYHLPLF